LPALTVDLDVPLRVAKQRAIDALERAYIGALLEACGGRVAEVARRARRNRKQVYRWMDAYGIPRGTGRKR
jgi:DNA-binding NtrC family response regulator